MCLCVRTCRYQQSHVDLMQTYESFNQELIDLFKVDNYVLGIT